MTCPTCRTPVPDGLLVCQVCLIERAARELWIHQYEYMHHVDTGEWQLLLGVAKPSDNIAHVLMFDGNKRAFCGLMAPYAAKRDKKIPYTTKALESVCVPCRQMLERAMAEAREQKRELCLEDFG